MVTVRRPPRFALDSGLQAHLAHQAGDPLAVDVPVASLQFGGHPPIAVGRELPGDIADRGFERLILRGLGPVVEGAAREVQHGAHRLLGVVLGHLRTQLPFLLAGEVKSAETFFAISNSRLSLPAKRSNAAIRAWCGSVGSSRWKTLTASARNWAFHFDTRSGLRLCSRPMSAAGFWPLMISKTTLVLNSGVN